ncbi:hypothetical protein PFICI_04157 [Pestalotiopsis fici W106-1]|uniref:Uncharacterized protein n=1 Tax=Pestalotiopsis fici (strain W106-1 / CGMCC3.15140) TaxID=1229662 RepID=W3XKY6_PESFW|nr:uncharacterized protein PFICI_04157 [Pestalotiopsis fici W106-1]ETS86132.1 hypothetical protein PFICI_04157 [Pestalotiopsis fici W106-1]
MATSNQPTKSDQPYDLEPLQRATPQGAFIDISAAQLMGPRTRCPPQVWTNSQSSYGTQQTSRTCSSISTYQSSAQSWVSPTSTMCEMPGHLALAELPSPSQPVFGSALTESPVTEDLRGSALSLAVANIDLDMALSTSLRHDSYDIQPNWSMGNPDIGFTTPTKSDVAVPPPQPVTEAFGDDFRFVAPGSILCVPVDTERRVSGSSIQAPEPHTFDFDYHEPDASQSSPSASLRSDP